MCDEINSYSNGAEPTKLSIWKRRIPPQLDSPSDSGPVALPEPRSDLSEGLCHGATISWCRLVVEYPTDTSLKRIERLCADLERVVSQQFQHLETTAYRPLYMKGEKFESYGEYLDAMCRVSRLKFRRAIYIEDPMLPGKQAVLRDAFKPGELYYFHLRLSYSDAGQRASACHAVALTMMDDGSARFFEYSIGSGELTIPGGAVGTFFREYWQEWMELGCNFSLLVGFSVDQLPNREVVETRARFKAVQTSPLF